MAHRAYLPCSDALGCTLLICRVTEATESLCHLSIRRAGFLPFSSEIWIQDSCVVTQSEGRQTPLVTGWVPWKADREWLIRMQEIY